MEHVRPLRSLSAKLLLATLLTVVFFVLVYESLVLVASVGQGFQSFRNEQTLRLEVLAERVQDPYWSIDRTAVETILSSTLKEGSFLSIKVKDHDTSSVFAEAVSTDRLRYQMTPPIYMLLGFTFNQTQSRALMFQGQTVGTVEVQSVFLGLEQKWEETLRRVLVEIVLFSLLIPTVVGFAFQWTVNRPLKGALAGLEALSHGDFSRPLQIEAQDEIGVLSRGINDMAKKLESSYSALNNENRILEDRIKERTRDLTQSEQALRVILDSLPDAVFIHDPAGRILEVNGKMLEMYGLSDRSEAIGKTPLEFSDSSMSPNEALVKLNLSATGRRQVFEWLAWNAAERRSFWVEVCLQRIDYRGEPRILASVHDIGAQKATQADLEEKAAELERFNRLMVGREIRMIQLKKEANQLHKELGRPAPYQDLT